MNFTTSPELRAALRGVLLAVLVYLAKVFGSDSGAFELESFVWGLGGVLVYAFIAILSPLEPFVGVKSRVEVPAKYARPTGDYDDDPAFD